MKTNTLAASTPRCAGKTDVGRVRKINEDNILICPEFNLYVVADGVGGHSRGEVASAVTIAAMRIFFQITDGGMKDYRPADPTVASMGVRRLGAAVRWANNALCDMSTLSEPFRNMGTTVVAAHFSPETGSMHLAHAGDSRCYRIRRGRIEQRTRDHSLANEIQNKHAQISEAELAKVPRNVVTRALGLDPLLKIDLRTEDTFPNDIYLLCSDGLSQLVAEADMLGVILVNDDLQKACDRLVTLANRAGGFDNISVVLLRFDDTEHVSGDSPLSADDGHDEMWLDSRHELSVELRATDSDFPEARVEDTVASNPFSGRDTWVDENQRPPYEDS